MNRSIQIIGRASLIAGAIFLVEKILWQLFPGRTSSEEVVGLVNTALLPLVSAFVLVLPLAYPIGKSSLRGKALLGVVFLAVFGLMTVLTQIESALFLKMTPSELWIEILKLSIVSAVVSWLAVALYPKLDPVVAGEETGKNPPSIASWVRRWVGTSLVYVVLYITAGLLILPVIRSWYEAQGTLDLNPAFFFPLQVARGALFVAVVLPLLRSMLVTRRQASLAMACLIPLVHGVASLIAPNPFMPDYVRHAHMIEIGWSNFVLGLLIGYLFWKPAATSEQEAIVLQPAERALALH